MPDNHMILSIDEAEKLSLLPKKTTVIIATCQCEMRTFMLSFLGFILRSKPENVEHFMVSINGGDDRYSDTKLQDKKQKFLQEIRKLKWHEKDMPLTINRVWSRIGHAQALEACIPWVHTEYYTIAHDDVLVQAGWCEESLSKLQEEDAIMAFHPPLLCGGVSKNYHENGWKISLPHMNTALITCKKPLMSKLGMNWHGHHVKKEFKLYDAIDVKEFIKYHTANAHIESFPLIEEPYSYVNMDIGAWIYDETRKCGYKMHKISSKTAVHLKGMSWVNDREERIKRGDYEYNLMEMELEKYPKFREVYQNNL